MPAGSMCPRLRGIHIFIQRQLPQHADNIFFQSMDRKRDRFVVQNTSGAFDSVTTECTVKESLEGEAIVPLRYDLK